MSAYAEAPVSLTTTSTGTLKDRVALGHSDTTVCSGSLLSPDGSVACVDPPAAVVDSAEEAGRVRRRGAAHPLSSGPRLPGSGSHPRRSRSRSAGISATASRIETSRSSGPSAASTATTSPSTGGYSGSPRCSPTPPGRCGTLPGTGGSSTRPTERGDQVFRQDQPGEPGRRLTASRSRRAAATTSVRAPNPETGRPDRSSSAMSRSADRRSRLAAGCDRRRSAGGWRPGPPWRPRIGTRPGCRGR
jgi:hypothetical protein